MGALLAARAEADAARGPDVLAKLLLRPESIVAAFEECTLPEWQLGELIATFGDGWTPAALAGVLCVPAADPDLGAVLSSLVAKGLVWPGGGAHLRAVWPRPMDLGPGAADLLSSLTVTQVRLVAERIGAPLTGRSKQSLIADVAAWMAVPGDVRDLVVTAPADVRDSLCASAELGRSWVEAPPWARDRGLVVPGGWGGRGQMPAEVALALRHVPFSPRPPASGTAGTPADAVEREAGAAATDMLGLVRAAADVFGRTPVTVLKNGGIGVKEMRRVAKAIGRDEPAARFVLEIAAAGGLVTSSAAGLTLSADFPAHTNLEPSRQLVSLAETWLVMPGCPMAAGAAVLDWDRREESVLRALRPAVLRSGAADPAEAAALVAWQRPALAERAGADLERLVAGIWREAHLLGLMAHGSVSRLGRSLVSASGDTIVQADQMVPPARDTVVLQNDLTAVVTGTPTAPLRELLDLLADPESRSGAWTWRFSPSSVRRAFDFDEGASAGTLIPRLTAVAGNVPQGLEYLIRDAERQHGRVRVHAVGCVLTSDEVALLDEIVAARPLAGLGLVRLAPTVVASGKPPAETLVALRDCGYAPSSVRAAGAEPSADR
jgi:hypothetical protein